MQALPLRVDPEDTNIFDEWYFETRGDSNRASWEEEDDCDECEEDCYDEET